VGNFKSGHTRGTKHPKVDLRVKFLKRNLRSSKTTAANPNGICTRRSMAMRARAQKVNEPDGQNGELWKTHLDSLGTGWAQNGHSAGTGPEMTRASDWKPLILLVAGEGFEPSTFGL